MCSLEQDTNELHMKLETIKRNLGRYIRAQALAEEIEVADNAGSSILAPCTTSSNYKKYLMLKKLP